MPQNLDLVFDDYHVIEQPAVHAGVAFLLELLISFGLMTAVLVFSNHERFMHLTGVAAGTLLVFYITFESPFSGMSMNPARTFGSAFVARDWTALWLYFTAPVIGMLGAAQLHVSLRGPRAIPCAKMRHTQPCIFCEYAGPPPVP